MEHVVADSDQWKRMRFKNNKVWMALDEQGAPRLKDGKGLIKYQLDQPHEYWVPRDKIRALDAPVEKSASRTPRRPKGPVKPSGDDGVDCENGICIYTDGACSGNPGPAGIGVVMRYKGHHKEIARYLGVATNNVAELEAIRTALLAVKNRRIPVILHTDSRYAWGLLTQNWKARQNQDLVRQIRELMTTFENLRLVHVRGHAGNPENERADRLAVAAVESRKDVS
jgi:ribonuclease HI